MNFSRPDFNRNRMLFLTKNEQIYEAVPKLPKKTEKP
jgi:hypothetical protein